MDKLEKALNKLSEKEQKLLTKILSQLLDWEVLGLHLKRLKGHKDIYRVRKGNLRVIFSRSEKGNIQLLVIERRSEKTYRDF